jgi:NADH:ubiquinone oxidoreductase subunit H
LLFLREYGFLLFFRYLISVILFGGSWLIFYLIFFILLGVRRRYPRYRYDKLMGFFWFQILPLIMFIFFFVYILYFC